ncbi:MAG: DUF2793 domain-containing protein [Pseudomonadota bacterium]
MFPLAVWQPGTLQPSTPVNDNALRVEVLARGATSILSTPPASPADGQLHIVGASPAGAWSTFAQNDVVIWRSGTWYRFAPFTGWLKQVGSDVRRFSGTAWEVVTGGGGGGAVPVQDEGTVVVAAPTAINFAGAGVTTTNVGGVATVTIPGGGGGGGGSVASAFGAGGATFVFIGGSTVPTTFGGFLDSTAAGQSGGPALSNDNQATRTLRTIWSGTNATNSVAGTRGMAGHVNTARPWRFEGAFVVDSTVVNSAHRAFFGVRESVAFSDSNPSVAQGIIGIGYDSADAQWHFMTRDTGTVTKTALGSSFAKPTVNTKLFKLVMVFNGTAVSWEFTDVGTGNVATGTTSATLPSAAQFLHYAGYVSAGGVLTTAQIGVASILLQTLPGA